MRKPLLFLTLCATLVYGQEPPIEQTPAPEELIPEVETEPYAATSSTRIAKSSGEWKNWAFAAGAAAVFTAGVLIVTLNVGSSNSGH